MNALANVLCPIYLSNISPASVNIMQTTLEQLLEEISFRRRKDLRVRGEPGKASEGCYSANQNTTYWTDLFVRHFLFQTEYEVDRDDLLFFIRKGNGYNNVLYKNRNQVDVSTNIIRSKGKEIKIIIN